MAKAHRYLQQSMVGLGGAQGTVWNAQINAHDATSTTVHMQAVMETAMGAGHFCRGPWPARHGPAGWLTSQRGEELHVVACGCRRPDGHQHRTVNTAAHLAMPLKACRHSSLRPCIAADPGVVWRTASQGNQEAALNKRWRWCLWLLLAGRGGAPNWP